MISIHAADRQVHDFNEVLDRWAAHDSPLGGLVLFGHADRAARHCQTCSAGPALRMKLDKRFI